MSEVAHNEPQEFWRPPVMASETLPPSLPTACRACGTEYMVGAGFCHVCGASRAPKTSSTAQHWNQTVEFLKALEFHRIKDWFALPTASLICFLAGIGCILGAIAVGIIYSVQNLADFQAIQLWRIEWLLAAVVAFLAGILLRR